eukprot:6272228-Pyramimonas_sp.AAC.2
MSAYVGILRTTSRIMQGLRMSPGTPDTDTKVSKNVVSKNVAGYPDTDTKVSKKYLGGESNSPVVNKVASQY